jgi:hypothetical protein
MEKFKRYYISRVKLLFTSLLAPLRATVFVAAIITDFKPVLYNFICKTEKL